MLWKFKKSGSQSAQTATSFSLGSPEIPVGAPQNTDVVSAAKVENADVSPRHVSGSYVIPRGYRIVGTVVSSRPVVVDGELSGPVLVAPSVTVGKGGTLAVPTQVSSISVEGVVTGPVLVRDTFEVWPGGEVRGDVEAGSLRIHPGGVIAGAHLAIGPGRDSSS